MLAARATAARSLRSCARGRCFVVPVAQQRAQGTWTSVVDSAKSMLGANPQPPPPSESSSRAKTGKAPIVRDPLKLVGKELLHLRNNVSSLLGSGHPSLDTIAKYYFKAEGKHIRPLIVLLMARATNGTSPLWPELLARSTASASSSTAGSQDLDMGINEPLSPAQVLNDFNPHMEEIEGKLSIKDGDAATDQMRRLATDENTAHILPTQRRLAEITEMIHVASLLHDDVIDTAESRRGSPSAPAAFGNKLSILGGDFLLARASVALARLRNNEVVELLATVIANLVEGEVMQLQAQSSNAQVRPQRSAFTSFWQRQDSKVAATGGSGSQALDDVDGPSMDMFEHYLQKTYLKTAALIGKSARASTILGGLGADAIKASGCGAEAEAMAEEIRDAAYAYGRNVGIAFQLVDDLLDFRSTSAAFGKPSGGADLRLGLTTAPVLFAWQEKPHEGLGELVKRKFSKEGDVEIALKAVRSSRGLERTTELAQHHADLAGEALMRIPPSEARDALEQLIEQVITRVK